MVGSFEFQTPESPDFEIDSVEREKRQAQYEFRLKHQQLEDLKEEHEMETPYPTPGYTFIVAQGINDDEEGFNDDHKFSLDNNNIRLDIFLEDDWGQVRIH